MTGIITLYYKNYNLGGLLQAYALQRSVQNMSVECEQLCIWHYRPETYMTRIRNKARRFRAAPLREIGRTAKALENRWGNRSVTADLTERRQRMEEFMHCIPHSKREYGPDNIHECLKKYDAFITGSDQVWNETYVKDPYLGINLLEFVPEHILKIAYAASGIDDALSGSGKMRLNAALASFRSISVRERSALRMLDPGNRERSRSVLDPVFLVDRQHWEKLSSASQMPEETKGGPFAFVYLLGDEKKSRDLARRIAALRGLEITAFVHAQNVFCRWDQNFGDRQVAAYGPADFLRMIKDSSIVITDSFHAVSFSILFETPFFVIERADGDSIHSRITDLLDDTDLRMCMARHRQTEEYFLENPDFSRARQVLKRSKEDSEKFLEEALYPLRRP